MLYNELGEQKLSGGLNKNHQYTAKSETDYEWDNKWENSIILIYCTLYTDRVWLGEKKSFPDFAIQ